MRDSIPVAHHNGVGCSQIRLSLDDSKWNILRSDTASEYGITSDNATDWLWPRWTYRLLVELHEAGDDAVVLQGTHQVNDTAEGELSKNCSAMKNAHKQH